MSTHKTFSLFVTVAALGAVALTSGCVATTPDMDAKYGDAVRAARQMQTLNPAAPKGNDPVLGVSGTAAVSAQERYQDSFKSPVKTFGASGIGGSIGGGQ